MNELILHHYTISPFSEKIRLVLAYKKLPWKSVLIPKVMPKPDVVALTGGYRKTPILQIGADIYCDTALICDVLEHLAPAPTLYPADVKGLARILAQWADNTLFWSAMSHNFVAKGVAELFAADPPGFAKSFAEDRARMRIAVPRLPAADAASAYKSHLRRLANMLDEQPYLLGDLPSVADFSAYHPLWFTRHVTGAVAGILDTAPVVLQWMDRMAKWGAADAVQLSATDAIAIARRAAPEPVHDAVFQDDHAIALGARVTIASDSFGPEPTEGELISATRTHYTLRRVDDRAGTVHVHFPRLGYVLKAASVS